MNDSDRPNWRLILPLIILFVIGIAGFWAPTYVPAIAALIHDKVSSEWLGFLGNLVGGLFTLTAATVAWFAVKSQIRSQANFIEADRTRKEFAAKAVLPLALSELHRYATKCIRAIDRLPDPVPSGTVFEVPVLPTTDIQQIKGALEHMHPEPAKQLMETLHFLQIHHARLEGIVEDVWDGELNKYILQRRMINALDLLALINRSFSYARGESYKAAQPTSVELRSSFDTNVLHDVNYDLVLIEIKKRQDIEAKEQSAS